MSGVELEVFFETQNELAFLFMLFHPSELIVCHTVSPARSLSLSLSPS